MAITEETFKRVSLEDPDGKWELYDGCLRQKPEMAFEHNHAGFLIGHFIALQLDLRRYVVRVDSALIRRSATRYFIPDVMVIPMDDALRLFPEPGMWEVYPEPLPLVVEVWSPSTGRYDFTDKLADYRRRGDREIWLVHPYQRTLTAWRRQPDGTYRETVYQGGRVEPASLPDVSIDLDEIFSMLR
jgi:Uma2 family endonuclease